MANSPHTDRQLLSWVRDDPEAFGVFYERYEAAVLAFFMRRTFDAEVSADLAAETFAAALAHCRRQGPVDVAQPIAWLFAIARRKLIDSWRRGVVQDRARRALGMEHVEIGEETLERIEALGADPAGAAALGALEHLAPDQQEAIRRRIIDEADYPNIARELGCSQALVRKRVSRGLALLRAELQEKDAR
jgi:RNA polymerase sigma factor (sigma-70 family)